MLVELKSILIRLEGVGSREVEMRYAFGSQLERVEGTIEIEVIPLTEESLDLVR